MSVITPNERCSKTALAVGDPLEAFRDFLARYFAWLADPDEQRRRRVNVQVWAEALHNPKIEQVITEGLAPIEPVTNAMVAARPRRSATRAHRPGGVQPSGARAHSRLCSATGMGARPVCRPLRDTVLQMVDTTLGSAAVVTR